MEGGTKGYFVVVWRGFGAILILTLLIWSYTSTRISDWQQNRAVLASKIAQSISGDIANYIELEQNRLKVFLEDYAENINYLAQNPDDSDITEFLLERVRRQFPGAFTFSIANSKAEVLLEDFEGTLGQMCISDLKQRALISPNQPNTAYAPYIHPKAHAFHFDLIAKVVSNDTPLTFLVSLLPERAAEFIKRDYAKDFNLVLLDADNPSLIELSEMGARDKLTRNSNLNTQEIDSIIVQIVVPNTRWLLAVLPNKDGQKPILKIRQDGVVFFLIMLMTTTLLTVWLAKAEKRRLEAEYKLHHVLRADLDSSSASIQALITSAADAIIFLDEQKRVILFNSSAETIFGYLAEEMIGTDMSRLMPSTVWNEHKGGFNDFLQTLHKKALSKRIEKEGLHKDGTIFPIEISMSEAKTADRNLYICIIDDISERKAIDVALRDSIADLEQFAYAASHDLKSPLRGIRQLAVWIKEDLGDLLEGEVKTYIAQLDVRVKRLEHLLNDLLAYSRAGRNEELIEQVDTKQLIDEITSLILPSKQYKVMLADEMPVFDTTRTPLMTVFQNLIDNAIKHKDKESCLITIHTKLVDQFYVFRVADNGPGIDAEFHHYIFETFKTLKPRDEVEGSGMGLAIVKKIVKRYGGNVWVEQGLKNQGITFCFEWPKVIAIKKY